MVARKPIFANKEDAQAREALRLYEEKAYKKALKLVDQNLKKNSSHAELLAIKACCNLQLGHDAESHIQRALAKEPRNYIVNHLAGLYFRQTENYPLAAQWFKAALDHGSPNTAILRDLALLQSQVRDYKNLKSTRQRYLDAEPGYRANWTSVAVAHHLNRDYDGAVNTLKKIEGIIKPHLKDVDRYEQSECVLYKNAIIQELGHHERALRELEEDTAEIYDRTSFLEYKAQCLIALGRRKEALLPIRELLQRSPENVEYYRLLETALDTVAGPVERRLALYDRLAAFYPKLDPVHFLPLTFLPPGDEFERRAEKYVTGQLQRGVPATFVNVKPLYKNPQKGATIGRIVESFMEGKLSPTVYVWGQYFLAQHYLHLKNLKAAETAIDAAMHHTPTLVELYMLKARIAKHQGRLDKAADVMEAGRQLDLQDRFVNTKAAKYYFRCNRVDDAVNTISLFTKNDSHPNGIRDLHLMQVNWVLVESAEAYYRLYKEQLAKVTGEDTEARAEQQDLADLWLGLALKRFSLVVAVFGIYHNDQLDFHSYCMRRGTPRDYIQLLQWEDRLHATPIYVRAVRGISKILWDLHAQPSEPQKPRRRKPKTYNIKKRAELVPLVELKKDDADPLGAKALLEAREDVLPRLDVFVKQLTTEAEGFHTTWDLAFRVYTAEGKYVLALQALRSLDKFGRNEKRARELKAALEGDDTANPAIVKVAQKGLAAVYPGL